jgi:hypothetical protein
MRQARLAVELCKEHGVGTAICLCLKVQKLEELKDGVMVAIDSVDVRCNPDVLVDIVTLCHQQGFRLVFTGSGSNAAVIKYLPKPLARRMGLGDDTTDAEKVVNDMFPNGRFVHNKKEE